MTWLLHLASFRLEYDSGKYENSFHWDFRILRIPFRLKQRAAVPKKKNGNGGRRGGYGRKRKNGRANPGRKKKTAVPYKPGREEPQVSGQKPPDGAGTVPGRESRTEQTKDSGGRERKYAPPNLY